MIGAATGVLFPIGLSYLLLYFGFGYGAWLTTHSLYYQRLDRLTLLSRTCGGIYHRSCAVNYFFGYLHRYAKRLP